MNENVLLENVKNMESLRCFKHDFLNHMNVLKIYLEMGMLDKSLEYVDKLTDYVEVDSEFKSSGNEQFDIVLLAKIRKFEKLGVEMHINTNLPEEINLEVFEVVTILGNLLDNAYEALKMATKKRLSLEINVVDDNLNIFVCNTHSNIITVYNDKIVTSKAEKSEHGLGLLSVENCVRRNNGQISTSYTTENFCVQVIIPVLRNTVNC